MIEIILANGDVRTWDTDKYSEYDVKGRFFVIMSGEQWVGMYALDQIVSVEVR